MSHETVLAIARFENRNGVISRRVTGSINGVRVRRNFKSREEAAAEKAALEIKSAQAAAGMRSALTFLPDERLREAEGAFRKLDGRKRSLLFYLDYAFTSHREPEHEKTVADAVSAYVAVKTFSTSAPCSPCYNLKENLHLHHPIRSSGKAPSAATLPSRIQA